MARTRAEYATVSGSKRRRRRQLLGDVLERRGESRVELRIRLVSDETFGQILITDCNPTRLQTILDKTGGEYSLYTIENGEVLR